MIPVRGCCETVAADLLASLARPVLTNVGKPTQLSWRRALYSVRVVQSTPRQFIRVSRVNPRRALHAQSKGGGVSCRARLRLAPRCVASALSPAARSATCVEQGKGRWRASCAAAPACVSSRRIGSVANGALYTSRAARDCGVSRAVLPFFVATRLLCS